LGADVWGCKCPVHQATKVHSPLATLFPAGRIQLRCYYSAPGRQVNHCNEHVCFSVCSHTPATPRLLQQIFTPPREAAASVCLFLCAVGEIISETTNPIFAKFYVHDRMLPVTYGRGSVFLWRRCDMLYTSGFVNDVTFEYNGLGNVDADKESTQNDPPGAAPNRQWRILISRLPCLFLST